VTGYLDTLSAAYAAVADSAMPSPPQKAIELARRCRAAGLAKQVETRLELYRAGRAYRAPAV